MNFIDDLTADEKRTVYEEVKMDYLKEDARMHIADMKSEEYAESVPDETCEKLAELFIKEHDCNIAENDLWDSIISDWLRSTEAPEREA